MTFQDDIHAISEVHIRGAIAEIDKLGIPKNRRSTKWGLKIGEHLYPPKYVLSLASKLASGQAILPIAHSGGEQTNKIFRALGFEIVPCSGGSNTREI